MGTLAVALSMLAKMALTAALGIHIFAWIAGLIKQTGLFGFLGQITFAVMPLLARLRAE
jgi:hypothetical protein